MMECDDCGTIGCIRCMRKNRKKWVCYKCKEPERKYYYPAVEKKEEEVSNAFAAMFG